MGMKQYHIQEKRRNCLYENEAWKRSNSNILGNDQNKCLQSDFLLSQMNHQQLLLSQKLIESPSLGSTKGEGETGFHLINHKVSWTVLQRWNINILAALCSSLQSSTLDLITRSSRKLNLIFLLTIDGLWFVCPATGGRVFNTRWSHFATSQKSLDSCQCAIQYQKEVWNVVSPAPLLSTNFSIDTHTYIENQNLIVSSLFSLTYYQQQATMIIQSEN